MPESPDSFPAIGRVHHRRLRDIHRSAGWPCQDIVEVELLAAGLLERHLDEGRERLRVTDAGIQLLARVFAGNKAARSAHEALVEQVATAMARSGRLAWRGLALRVALPMELLLGEPAGILAQEPRPDGLWTELAAPEPSPAHGWCMACPDVFSIRHSSVEAYLEPVVHEIKVQRSDLLGDLKRPAKRAAYLGMAGACWYVLGEDAKGRPIGAPDEVPPECGVMLVERGVLRVAREAPRRAIERLPFHVWMTLAKAGPAWREDDAPQRAL
ncbi:hypothetical protein [Hydrogenophaga sp. RWCD_12]|uniref:hypothetical protein n=1 Tax=Hydrogenophaga sp. RWCD_12 TaxID=3391190 RepID=UPI0039847761